jgi:pentatricopeptide repeat protein
MPKKYNFQLNATVYTCLMSACCACGQNEKALELLRRMIKERVWPDQKTYSTIIRGAIKGGNADVAVAAVDSALGQGTSRARRLLEEELVQGTMSLLTRRRLMEVHGNALAARLRDAGFLAGTGFGAGMTCGTSEFGTSQMGFGGQNFSMGPAERNGSKIQRSRK